MVQKPGLNRIPYALGVLLVAGVVFAYQPAWHAGYIWDDDAYVTENPLLSAPDGWSQIWFSADQPSQYFPLVYTALRLESRLWGLNPTGYHWFNILLHALNALLVWRLLTRLRVPGAWLAAAIFALHPVQVETVAWITEHKNLMTLCFSLLALLAWVEFVEDRPQPPWRYYGLALFCYLLALFSKTTACTLPAALLLILWFQHKDIGWRRILQIVPFLLLGLAMGLVTMWVEQHRILPGHKIEPMGWLARLLVAAHAIWFYLGKLLWPAGLAFSYPRWVINPADPLAYAWLAACAALAGVIWYTRRFVGRCLETGALFYVATLSPLLGFITLTTFEWSFVADHYQYVACIGPIALAAAGLATLAHRFAGRTQLLQPAACAVVLPILASLTYHQAQAYHDDETLWRDTLAKNPASTMAHNSLGRRLVERGDLDEAMRHYRAALDADPGNVMAANNIGWVLLQRGQTDAALAQWQRILQVDPRNPDVHDNIAAVLYRQGHVDEAVAHWQAALDTLPSDPKANNNLGSVLLLKGQFDEAAARFQKALAYNPNISAYYLGLGNVFARKGEFDQAVAMFQKAVQLQPDNPMARFNLGSRLLQMGRAAEAIPHLQKAVALQPDDVEARNHLLRAAWLLATSPAPSARDGRLALASALSLNQLAQGSDPAVLSVVAAAYAETGNFPLALATARHAAELADAQTNAVMVNSLQAQLQFYQSGQPLRVAPPPGSPAESQPH